MKLYHMDKQLYGKETSVQLCSYAFREIFQNISFIVYLNKLYLYSRFLFSVLHLFIAFI